MRRTNRGGININMNNIDLKHFVHKDGLVKTKDIRVNMDTNGNYTFNFSQDLTNQVYYPSMYIKSIVDILLKNNSNREASIKVIQRAWSQKRACIYGVSFATVIKKSFLDRKMIKSQFSLQNAEFYEDFGVVSNLIVHITPTYEESGEIILTLEAWVPISDTGEAFYIHARFSCKNEIFLHLDDARICFFA